MDSKAIHRQVLVQLGFSVERVGRFYALKDRDGNGYVNGRKLWQNNRLSEKVAWEDAPSLQALMPVLMLEMQHGRPAVFRVDYTNGLGWTVMLINTDDPNHITYAGQDDDLYTAAGLCYIDFKEGQS